MTSRLFIHRDFSLLWTASFIEDTGDMFYALAMAWMVLERTRSPLAVGAYLVAAHLPGFLISPWAGMLIDRLDRKRILVATSYLRAVIVGLATLLVFQGRIQLGHMLGVAALLSLCSAFFNPTSRIAVSRLVPDNALPAANARMQIISGATAVAGPLGGALLMGMTGYAGAFLINALCFAISGTLILFIRGSMNAAPSARSAASVPGGSGFRFLLRQGSLCVIIGLIFAVHLFFGSLAVILPFLARGLSGRGLLDLGLMEAALGLGMLGGAALLEMRNTSPDERGLFRIILLMGSNLAGLGLLQGLGLRLVAPHAVLLIVTGVCVASASVFWTTLLQRRSPSAMAGRVFSLASAAGNIALPIAYGLFGILQVRVPLSLLLLASGGALVAIGILAARLDLRALAEDPEVEAPAPSTR